MVTPSEIHKFILDKNNILTPRHYCN